MEGGRRVKSGNEKKEKYNNQDNSTRPGLQKLCHFSACFHGISPL